MEKRIRDLKQQIIDTKTHLANVQNNKTSIKTLWMKVTRSSVTQDDIQLQIDNLQKELDASEDLLDYMTFYIPLIVFPRFKRDRGSQYFRFLENFTHSHQTHATKHIAVWTKVLDVSDHLDKKDEILKKALEAAEAEGEDDYEFGDSRHIGHLGDVLLAPPT